ncbi:MAG: hypothetical protein JETT_3100 [Candidatus Jettenia ecosi]|uniref:Uncharacterized protein n=1 Tax=Candidatus Jettenia ecosi TaxID=2494326 RepID=A0A533Q7M5_9BACT|nr:MAG: hypothetical protein JETT_3100 [Candidatus Jettenia ecosi]
MEIHRSREDLSRFLVHLTRDYKKECALFNLISILKNKAIFAKNAHCLVMHKINNMRFSNLLKSKFNTVCFTETPLPQIRQLVLENEGRKIQLRPYGLVFGKDNLFNKGASPAQYINAKGTSISKFLLDQFDSIFKGITTLKKLKKAKAEHYENIVHYYSLINVVEDKNDFLWEREWRHHGNFTFNYYDVVAIVATDPEGFEKMVQKKLSKTKHNHIKKIPIIDPDWTYEELLENFAINIRKKLSKGAS